MKAASFIPVDRSGLYSQLHYLLQPGQGSVLDLLPAESRPIWEALAAVVTSTASQQQRSGAPIEAQQEKALQQLEQLLEAAESGKQVYLTADGCPSDTGNEQILLNRIIPQILAHRSTAEERDYHEEELVVFNESLPCTDGNRCTNKEQVLVEVLNRKSSPPAAANCTDAVSAVAHAGSEMADDIHTHWKWHQRRVQLLRGRLRRLLLGLHAKTDEGLGDGDIEVKRVVKSEEKAVDNNEVEESILVGRLSSEGGRKLCWSSALLEPFDGSSPVQLLQLEQALRQQSSSICNGRVSVHDEILYSGMIVAVRGHMRQDGFGLKMWVTSILCGAPLPRPRQQINLGADGTTHTTAKSCYRGQNVHIMMASAAFLESFPNGGWRLRRRSIEALLCSVRETMPHVVILFGPIISSLNVLQPSIPINAREGSASSSLRCASLLQLPELNLCYREFFQLLETAIQGMRTRIVLVPSSRDVIHPEPIPQPPYPLPLGHQSQSVQNVYAVSNPCTIQVNDVRILLTSSDPVAEIAADTLCSTTASKELQHPKILAQQFVCSLLRQRTLFPRGATSKVQMDAVKMAPLLFDTADAPHIIAFPSCIATQEKASSRTTGGSFACEVDGRMFVSPFCPTLSGGDDVQICNVYVHPPASTVEEECDMQLPLRIAVRHRRKMLRSSLRAAGSPLIQT